MSYDAFPAHESTRKRRRWGCTCGCLAVLIVLLIGGSILTFFAVRTNKELPPYALMDESIDGYGVLRIDSLGDNGMREFSKLIFTRLQKSQAAGQDPNQAKIMEGFAKVASQFINTLIQHDSYVYLSYDPAAADESALVTTPLKNRGSWYVLRNFLSNNFAAPDQVQDANEIYSVTGDDGTSAVAVSVGARQIIVSDSATMLSRSITYSKDANRFAEAPDRLQQFINELALEQPVEGQDLTLAVVNEESRIANFLVVFEEVVGVNGLADKLGAALASQKLSFNDITGAKITADLQTADKLVSEVTLYCRTNDMATKLSTIFRNALSQVVGKQDDSPITLGGDARARGSAVVVELELAGLRKWVEEALPVAEATPAGSEEASAAAGGSPADAVAPPQ